MMAAGDVLERCLKTPGAYANAPFGPEPICARVGPRIFAEVYPARGWATFKCEPPQGLCWRAQYPDAVRRGYHCPPARQPYNNTVDLDGSVPDGTLLEMIKHSYVRALKTMTRAQRAEAFAKQGR